MNLSEFEKEIGCDFKNQNLIKEALTHRSYLNERPDWGVSNNERLEYLGDAVLELSVTKYLFDKFPKSPEGELTVLRAALVNYQMLSRVAEEISLEKFIFLSRGEAQEGGKAREVILANAMEAVIGAIYLDQGFNKADGFIEKYIIPHLKTILKNKSYRDSKSKLQEVVQEKFKVTPNYKVIEESGPAHKKIFKIGVYFNENLVASGTGLSKQEAELEAAEKALKEIRD